MSEPTSFTRATLDWNPWLDPVPEAELTEQ